LQENEEMCKKRESETFYEDLSSSQLPKPISYDLISQLFEKTNNKDFPDNLFIKETKNLTYLVCCFGTSINIFVYGYFLLVEANLDLVESHLHYKQLQSCFLSDDTSLISTLGLTHENLLVYSILDSHFLQENHVQIKMVSTKFGMLFSMLTAVKNVIKEMEELWEDILVEMDQKFQLYALEKYNNNNKGGTTPLAMQNNANGINNNNNQSDSSLVNDFMLLYSFGSCSEHFKNFLLNELTEKGLKKLELSVENYYSSIQRLLSGNFHQYFFFIYSYYN
jgi:anaphase-promoting complex subunit 4